MQNRFHEAVVNLTTGEVERNVRLGENVHGNGDYDEILTVEKNALEDEGVQAEIAKLKLPEGTIVCADPWIYGTLPTRFPLLATDISQARAELKTMTVSFLSSCICETLPTHPRWTLVITPSLYPSHLW